MMRTPGVSSWTRRAAAAGAGLTGYRYLLAVAVLVALTSVPMLVAVVAGAATLSEAPPPPGDATPFVTYQARPVPDCPGWPNQPR